MRASHLCVLFTLFLTLHFPVDSSLRFLEQFRRNAKFAAQGTQKAVAAARKEKASA